MPKSRLDEIVSRCDSWEESKHPRDSDGQFASSGSSRGREVSEKDKNGLIDRLKDQKNHEGSISPRQATAYQLLRLIVRTAAPGSKDTTLIREDGGRVVSGIQYEEKATEIHIHQLASLQSGEGSRWIEEIRKKGKDLTLDSTEDSVPFYEKMGFVKESASSNSDQILMRLRHD